MPRPKRQDFMRPVRAAAGEHNGCRFVLNPNEIYDADHDLVREYPDLFVAVVATHKRPDVEYATAAPGEVRG